MLRDLSLKRAIKTGVKNEQMIDQPFSLKRRNSQTFERHDFLDFRQENDTVSVKEKTNTRNELNVIKRKYHIQRDEVLKI